MPYIGKAPSSGIRSRFIYTATAAQTTFTGADGNGKTLGYTDGEYVDVYLNGVLLDPADYTATSKTSVVLDSGATVSDIVEIVVYDTFSVFNGTFTGDLTVDGDTLFVDSTNNKVGVGETTGLLGKLHVKTADSSGSADSGADELVIENSGDTGLTILSGTTNSGSIRFGDSDDNDNGIIIYNHGTSPYMRFFVDAAERMRILSGGGITFNGDTAAANALDDYEEGTFIPTYGFSGGGGSFSYGIQEGRYTKIGRQVFVQLRIRGQKSGTGSGALQVRGLPFTPTSDTQIYGIGTIGYASGFTNAPRAAYVEVSARITLIKTQSSTDTRSDLNATLGNGDAGTASTSSNDLIISAIYTT